MILRKLGDVKVGKCILHLMLGNYNNNPDKTAIALDTPRGAPYQTVSICTPHPLAPGEFVLNHDVEPSMKANILASGLVVDTGKRVSYGLVQNQPVWRVIEKVESEPPQAA